MSVENDGRTPLQAEDRHRAIIDLVDARGSVTVRELAEELGVAPVTVRVDVRELARRGLVNRIHGGVTRHQGRQPETAGSLRSDPTAQRGWTSEGTPRTSTAGRTLGVIVPHASYYYPTVVSGARAAAEEHRARLVLGVSQNDVAEERALVSRMLDSGIDGLLIATRLDPQHSTETQDWLRSSPVPVVLVERRVGWDSGAVEHVATDHEHGAFVAVQHLAHLGHRQIGLLHFDTITAPRLRTGYDAALATLGLSPLPADVPRELRDDSPGELASAAEGIIRALDHGVLDALIVHHDVAALPLVGRLRQAGITVPDDLAIMAYDDELAALCDPPLTAVAPPRAEVGRTAVTMLLQRLENPDAPQRCLLLRPALRVRGSAGRLELGEPAAELVP